MARRKKGKRSGRSRGRRRSGIGAIPKGLVMTIVSAAAGALGATMISKLPIPFVDDPKLSGVVPLAGGVLLLSFAKGNQAIQTGALVMAGIGAANLAKSYVPGLNGIMGESYLQAIDAANETYLNGAPAPAGNDFLQGIDQEDSYNRQ